MTHAKYNSIHEYFGSKVKCMYMLANKFMILITLIIN